MSVLTAVVGEGVAIDGVDEGNDDGEAVGLLEIEGVEEGEVLTVAEGAAVPGALVTMEGVTVGSLVGGAVSIVSNPGTPDGDSVVTFVAMEGAILEETTTGGAVGEKLGDAVTTGVKAGVGSGSINSSVAGGDDELVSMDGAELGNVVGEIVTDGGGVERGMDDEGAIVGNLVGSDVTGSTGAGVEGEAAVGAMVLSRGYTVTSWLTLNRQWIPSPT